MTFTESLAALLISAILIIGIATTGTGALERAGDGAREAQASVVAAMVTSQSITGGEGAAIAAAEQLEAETATSMMPVVVLPPDEAVPAGAIAVWVADGRLTVRTEGHDGPYVITRAL